MESRFFKPPTAWKLGQTIGRFKKLRVHVNFSLETFLHREQNNDLNKQEV